MSRFTFFRVCLLVVCAFAFSVIAQAQATRTWVSGVGDDVNPCSRTAPCKTWAGAISKTAAGGEIDALDPGGYGTLTITKSITVDGTTGAGFGSTLNSGGINGFLINDGATATPGTIKVYLRNLSINGAGTTAGLNGIRFLSGAELHVDNVTIENQSGHAIDVAPTGARAELFVNNVRIAKLTGAGSAGVRLVNTSPNAAHITVARINRLIVDRVPNGVLAEAKVRAVVTHSHFSINGVAGINVNSAGGNSEVSISDCSISYSTAGLRAASVASSIVRATKSMLIGSPNAAAGGTITTTASVDVF